MVAPALEEKMSGGRNITNQDTYSLAVNTTLSQGDYTRDAKEDML